MKMFVAAIVVILVGIVGLGFYQGWFHVSSANADHKANVTITVDQDKMREDKDRVKDEVQQLGQQLKARTGAATAKVKAQDGRP